jgi:methyl-accepting chemotaxis protein
MSRIAMTGVGRFAAVTAILVVVMVLLAWSRHEAREAQMLSRLSLVSSLRSGGVLAELNSARSDAVLWSGFGNVRQRLMGLDEAWGNLGPGAPERLQRLYLAENPYPEGERHLLADAGDGSGYSRIHADFHPRIGEFLSVHDYYDLFLVDPAGRVVYSFYKEEEFGSDLVTGPWRDTGAGRVARAARALEAGQTAVSDFQPHEPSQGQWAMFVAAPITLSDGPEDRGALMFQLDPRRLGLHLFRIQTRSAPAETILLGSNYRILGQAPWIDAMDPEGSSLDAMVRALAVEGGEGSARLETASRDRVLAAWAPISFEGLNWIVLTSIDASAIWADGASERRAIALIGLLIWIAGGVLTLGRRRGDSLGQHSI